jgi:extradiol dioxygenase family protein
VDPILHLSIPVRDLDESVDFYVDVLGCELGRVQDRFADVWFFGMQVTLHERPAEVFTFETRGVHHFGVTLSAPELRKLLERVDAHGVPYLSELTTEYAGTPREQTKAKIVDPSANAIELKTYVDPDAAFFPTRA